jgi:hypothetical protein
MKRFEAKLNRNLRQVGVKPDPKASLKAKILMAGLFNIWEGKPKRRVKPKPVDKEWFCRTVLSALERLDRIEKKLDRKP